LKSTLLIATLAVLIAGCGKAPEPAKPAAATPATAPAPQANGGAPSPPANVACKTSPTAERNLPATEADLGVSFYPGARQGLVTRGTGPTGSVSNAELETADPPEKVLAFYREQLKAKAAGRSVTDSGPPDGNGNSFLELDVNGGTIQITATGNSSGTHVSIGNVCFGK
jgi:hypothetical protein